MSVAAWRSGHICVTHHTGSATDDEGLLVCFVVIAEGGMKCRLKAQSVSVTVEIVAMTEQTGNTRLITLKLRRQALIWVTVLL